jgi:recombination protein RecA
MARKTLGGVAGQVAARINAEMKFDAVTMASDAKYKIERVPTGILTIDRLLYGGFARGRHVEVFGDWLVGKSLLAYSTLALAQARGEVCALIDAEGVFNAKWFRALGGDPSQLIMGEKVQNANTLGNVLRLMIQKTEEIRGVDIVLIDSVASLLPREEQQYDLESETDPRTASLARLMSLMLRQLTTQNQDTLFIWTNQWRDKIGRIPGLKSTPGGLSLGFYASTRIEMAQGEKEHDEVEAIFKSAKVKRRRVVGRWVHCTVRKEKTGARPESAKSFLLDYATRKPDTARELVDLGMEDDLIRRTGNSFVVVGYDEPVKANGVKQLVKKINANPDLRAWLLACIEERTAELEDEDG